MSLSAVAIMANNVGCVCQKSRQVSSTSGEQDAVTAGMATIMLQQQQEQQRQQQQQQQLAYQPR